MKKFSLLCITALVMGLWCVAYGGGGAAMKLKAGDDVYTCACGEKCPCDTMSRKGGKCACSNELKKMTKGKVTKVEKGTATVSVNSHERTMKTTGKYACACESSCQCNTVSQIPGKCPCGKELKKAGS
ncbi:hypothetical protein KI811_12735 [Geobacter hydrogenophilus]|uniref:Uncharacterized protein n=1 Tax=Geobacter hydrogenophilus TaxID=40983 RepID=A0A9W6FZ73_9BACT|nr:hypothetical protein [Geobacter hydrogenophilus]MBT0894675.1 hypothetical protein [Geobacter hydrogenophilus]GLI37488.1 hypothetical protein GHYDROH2_09890 [Geobacter hydrogenophilus]